MTLTYIIIQGGGQIMSTFSIKASIGGFKMRCLILWLLLFSIAVPSFAAQKEPATLSYQGTLTDNTGIPLTGTKTITVSLYDVPTIGTAFWSDSYTVSLKNGQFSVVLGSDTKPLTGLFNRFQGETYIGIKVGTDLEMPIRQKMASVAYAINGLPNDSIALPTGVTGAGRVGLGTKTPREKLDVTGNIIATGNITASGNVSASGAVSSGSLSTGNITSAGNITATSGVISSNSISTGNISSTGNITAASGIITSNSVSTGNINSTGDITAANGVISASALSASTLNIIGEARMNGNLLVFLKPGNNGTVTCEEYCNNCTSAGVPSDWGRPGACIGSMNDLGANNTPFYYRSCTWRPVPVSGVTCICISTH